MTFTPDRTPDRTSNADLVFEAPATGVWTRDADHQATPRSPLSQELFETGFREGTAECFARYGIPLERLDGHHVHGWFYIRAIPAGAPDRPGTPPALVLKALTRLVPELRRRERAAAAAIDRRLWLDDAATWEAERGDWIRLISELLADDPTLQSAERLALHTQRALDLTAAMIRRHFSLLGPSLAVGRMIVAAQRWGIDAASITSALQGRSPHSSASSVVLAELAEIPGAVSAATVDALRRCSPRAAELVQEYMSIYGIRPLTYDIAGSALIDQPEQLLALVRGAQRASSAMADDQVGMLRAAVPHEARAEFDRYLADAEACYPSLDDNSGVSTWTLGVARRAVREVARRAHDDGLIAERNDVFLMSRAELAALAGSRVALTADELAARRGALAAAAAVDPPVAIGGMPSPPPSPTVFPRAMAAQVRAMDAYLSSKFTERVGAPIAPTATVSVDGTIVGRGQPVVEGNVTARIVVCADPSHALGRIEPGDILVCPYTSAAWNGLFPLIGGIATVHGGPLGHTAVMAREFGVPALVGMGSLPETADERVGTLDVRMRRIRGS